MARRRKRTTLSQKIGVSQATLSAKIAKVMRDDPTLTRRQAAGKAAGILAGPAGRKKIGRRRRRA